MADEYIVTNGTRTFRYDNPGDAWKSVDAKNANGGNYRFVNPPSGNSSSNNRGSGSNGIDMSRTYAVYNSNNEIIATTNDESAARSQADDVGGTVRNLTNVDGSIAGFDLPEAVLADPTFIQALADIDVEGIVARSAEFNREQVGRNVNDATAFGRKLASDAYLSFSNLLEDLVPGYSELNRNVTETVSAFVQGILPPGVRGNATLADAQALNASGVRGGLAVRRLFANEMSRDVAAIQYGIGEAQNLINSARATAGSFADLQADGTLGYLEVLNELTTLTPGQNVDYAFANRDYRTAVDQFNAGVANDFALNNAQVQNEFAVTGATLAFQGQQAALNIAAQRDIADLNARTQRTVAATEAAATVGGAALGNYNANNRFDRTSSVGGSAGGSSGGTLTQQSQQSSALFSSTTGSSQSNNSWNSDPNNPWSSNYDPAYDRSGAGNSSTGFDTGD